MNCLSLNADNLRNKLEELSTLVYIHNPDIIMVQELLPKNSEILPSTSQYTLEGYELFANEDSWERGVAIYIKNDIKATKIDSSTLIRQGKESVWVEVRLKNNDKLIVGSMYRSPNASRESSMELFGQMRCISDTQPSHLLIAGDFNLPDIDWELESSPNSLSNLSNIFMENYRDCFLYQHVMAPTHHRPG